MSRYPLRSGGKVVLTTVLVGIALLLPARVAAHDVVSEVTLHLQMKPEGDRLRILARVPLEALQDMLFPTMGPGYLDLERLRETNKLGDSADLWIGENLEIFEDGRAVAPPRTVAARISIPSDRSFSAWQSAVDHVSGEPLPSTTRLVWQQALLDVLLETPIRSADSRLSIRPHHAQLGVRVETVLRYVLPSGDVRIFRYGGEPGLVDLDPRWHRAAGRFVGHGFFHILEGLDHLLFLACLVIPLRRLRDLVLVVTSFTAAHSVTLIASAFGFAPDNLWFAPLVELLIAASIVYMALENIVGARTERRWMWSFAFGLVHGFGFAFVLGDTLQFAGSHLLTSLLAFNVGVELGQIFVLVLAIPVLDLFLRRVVDERLGVIVLSALVAHTSWHWMTERASTLAEFDLWPGIGPHTTPLLPWIAPVLIVAALAWRYHRGRREASPSPTATQS